MIISVWQFYVQGVFTADTCIPWWKICTVYVGNISIKPLSLLIILAHIYYDIHVQIIISIQNALMPWRSYLKNKTLHLFYLAVAVRLRCAVRPQQEERSQYSKRFSSISMLEWRHNYANVQMFSHLSISYMTGCLMCTQWLCLFQVTGTDIAVIETTGITRTYISKMTYKA